MSTTKTIISGAGITAIVGASVLYPLVVLHGYRQWWVVTFYGVFASAVVAGTISHYRLVRRNGKS